MSNFRYQTRRINEQGRHINELNNRLIQMREALESLAHYALPEITRGPAVDGWCDAAEKYIQALPRSEYTEEFQRLLGWRGD